jgi:uncharacterized protein
VIQRCYDRESGAGKFYRESVERAMKESGQFQRGIELFNAQKFFEAHEVWEELWLAEREPEKTFLQGMIQVAAAFHHHCRGNLSGTRSLLAAGLVKLLRFPDNHRGVALAKLRSEAERCGTEAGTGERLMKLPKIRMVTRKTQRTKRA